MQAREHHFAFAKKLIPSQVFQSTDRMFAELTGPKREAFLMFLWNEAAKTVAQPLPHVAVEGTTLSKLEVVGALKRGATEIVVLSMPPALNPNEAIFVAPVRGPNGVSVFFYERCLDQAGTGVHTSEAVIAEARSDGSRVNHGFHPGLDLQAFKANMGKVLDVSLDGLESSLPPITMAAFMGQGAGPGIPSGFGAGGGARKADTGAGGALEKLTLVRAALPLGMFVLSFALGSFLGPVGGVLRALYMLLSFAIGVLLLVWLHQVYNARRETMKHSPGMAVGAWFIPGANVVFPAFIVRGAWDAVCGPAGGGIVYLWWVFWLLEIVRQTLMSLGFMIVSTGERGMAKTTYVRLLNESIHMPEGLASMLAPLWQYSGLLIGVTAYGLLWHIVKTINAKS